MKKMILNLTLLILAISFALPAKAENDAYTRAMQNAIEGYANVKNLEDYQQIANNFERIAQMEKEKWLPRYYTALTYVYMSFGKGLDKDQRDEYLAIAQEHADAAEERSENNVEIVILQGYIKMAKLSVSPALRGITMAPQATQLFEQARQMAPENPRAAVMLAQMKYGTAQFFNSSTEESCDLAQESLALYDKETERGIQPYWGKGLAESLLINCD